MEKSRLEKTARIMLITVLGGVIGYFALKYILPVAIPFILAYAVAAIIRPLTVRFCKDCPKLDKPATVLFLVILVALVLWGAYSLVSLLISQISGLINSLSSDLGATDNPIRRVVDFFVNIRDRIPFLSEMKPESADRIYEIISRIIENGVVKITSAVTDFAAALVGALPSAAIAFVVALSAMFYFSLDRGSFAKSIKDFLPDGKIAAAAHLKNKVCRAMLSYLKSYLVMMLIVFAQLYLGLTVIGIRYSFVIALLISFVDLLPVLGVGTVLIPWSAISLISGDTRTGVGLAILFVIMTVVRQLLEPRIIGSYIGIHPILALASVYLGMELFGLAGLLFAPIVLYIARSIITEQRGETAENPQSPH